MPKDIKQKRKRGDRASPFQTRSDRDSSDDEFDPNFDLPIYRTRSTPTPVMDPNPTIDPAETHDPASNPDHIEVTVIETPRRELDSDSIATMSDSTAPEIKKKERLIEQEWEKVQAAIRLTEARQRDMQQAAEALKTQQEAQKAREKEQLTRDQNLTYRESQLIKQLEDMKLQAKALQGTQGIPPSDLQKQILTELDKRLMDAHNQYVSKERQIREDAERVKKQAQIESERYKAELTEKFQTELKLATQSAALKEKIARERELEASRIINETTATSQKIKEQQDLIKTLEEKMKKTDHFKPQFTSSTNSLFQKTDPKSADYRAEAISDITKAWNRQQQPNQPTIATVTVPQPTAPPPTSILKNDSSHGTSKSPLHLPQHH